MYGLLGFTFMHLADAFIQSDLQCIQDIYFVSMCPPWESNPQPFALLTQCSTTEPQEHQDLTILARDTTIWKLESEGAKKNLNTEKIAFKAVQNEALSHAYY